jgi:hypothetical protein
MTATYGEEQSNLSEMNALLTFPFLHARNFGKRIVYNYFLRDFSVASLWLLAGGSMTMWGLAFGVMAWIRSSLAGEPATAGTVMLAALPLMLGIQLILSFMSHDIAMTPRIPLSDRLAAPRED